MTQLPLRIRTDIRDKWDPESSTIHKTTNRLGTDLGLRVKLNINWESLWADLEAKNADRATFIPLIESVAALWLQGILRWLDDEKWGDELLEKLSASKKQQLDLFILTRKDASVSTEWMPRTASISLTLPMTIPLSLSAEVKSAISQGLERLHSDDGEIPHAIDDEEASEWTDVIGKKSAGTTTRPAAGLSTKLDDLPLLDTITRPEQLFADTVPYMLSLTDSLDSIVVQCSHEATLELMKQYFLKYARRSTRSGDAALLNVYLSESSIGFGPMFNMLTIIRNPWNSNSDPTCSPTVVLAFIEGILGYKMVYTDGHQWIYRRDKAFVRK